MKIKLILSALSFLLINPAFSQGVDKPVVVDGGMYAKVLLPGLQILSGASVVGGALNPSVTAVSANIGSLYLSSNGATYQKGDNGLTTNWTALGSGGGGGAPTGPAGGSLSGTYPNPSLAATVTAGTSTKVTYNNSGQITSGTTLVAADIPSLLAAKISDFVTAVSAAIGFTPENVANKATDLTSPDNTKYPSTLAVSTALALKAPLASPALTGNPTAPTQTAADNSTKIATTAYADNAASSAAGAAIVQTITSGDTTHATSSGALFTALSLKAPLASPALTGNPTAPTQTAGDNSTKLATTAYADNASPVKSVFGRTGIVVANSGDYDTSMVPENTNLYFTQTRARTSLSATAPMAYNSTTGVFSTPNFIGDNFGGSVAGLVPAATSGQFENGSFLNAGGAFSIVDQSKPRYGTFKLVNMTAQAAGVMKFTDVIISPDSRHAYVSGGQNSMSVYNIQNQAAPKLEGTISLLGSYRMCQMTIASVPYLVVPSSGGSTLYMVNVSNPTSLSVTGSLAISGAPGSLYNCAVGGNYVYLSTQNKGLTVVDVSTPTLPVQVYQEGGTLNKSFGIALASNGTTLYTTNYDTAGTHVVKYLKTWDVTTPTAPSLLNTYTFPGNTKPNNLTLSGNYAYVTDSGLNQILVTDITTPTAPNQVAAITPTYVFDSGETAQLSANGNFAYIPSGGGAGANGGSIDLYDVTTKASPIKITTAFTNVANSVFGGITMNNGYIYAADYGVAPGSAGSLDVFTTGESVIGGNILTSTATFKSLTPSTALASDANNNVVSSSTTATELGYVHGVTSAIQTQINAITAGSVTAVTGTAPIVSSGGTTPAISCITATGSVAGCLSAADFTTFAAKQAALTFGNLTDVGTDGITVIGGTGAVIGSGTSVSQHVADTTHAGYLSATDWTTFNGKSPTLTFANSLVNTSGTISLVNDSTSPGNSFYYGTDGTGTKGYFALPAPGTGTVTAVSVVSANGFAGTVATSTTTPAITITTSITGILKGNGTAISAATSGTDYSAGTSALGTGILKSTTGTGVLSIATAADLPSLAAGNISSTTTLSTAVAIHYFGDTSGGAFTITLPAASANSGKSFYVTNITFGGSNNITVAVTGSDVINGASSDSITPGEPKHYASNGTSWFVEN